MNGKLSLVLLFVSLGITAVCFAFGLPFFFLFLFLPFIGFLPKRRVCPNCGVRVRVSDSFCPACGTKLEDE
ncbi:MAG TPA: zinc ribbon domain-containing protein [Methanocorpusculum sp.]|nr:zinc ribbon domain-containing protein [Methanocorpusculum sp.]